MKRQELELTTQGEPTLMVVQGRLLAYETYNTRTVAELTQEGAQLARYLIDNVNTPLLGSWIQDDTLEEPDNHKMQVMNEFRALRASDPGTAGLAKHLISLGRGKATWYGCVSNDEVAAKQAFCDMGSSIVELTAKTPRQAERQQKTFAAFREYLENDHTNHDFFSRPPHRVAAAAIIITAGAGTAATVWALRKRREQ